MERKGERKFGADGFVDCAAKHDKIIQQTSYNMIVQPDSV